MHTKKIEQLLMSFLFTGLIFIHIIMSLALAVGLEEMERLCSYLILGMGFLMFSTAFFCQHKLRREDFVFFLFVVFCLLVGAYRRWEVENVIPVLCFILMMTVWRSAEAVSHSHVLAKRVCIAYTGQGLLLIGLFLSPYAYESYQEYVEVSHELTLGFANPNQTGIILTSTIMILLIAGEGSYMNRIWKMMINIELLLLSVMLILTDARTSILSCVVFFVFYLFIVKKKKKFRRYPLMEDIIVCCPAFFVPFYLWLANKTEGEVIMFLGKKLISGRQRLYKKVLPLWWDKSLGNLKRFNLQNFHNAYFTILTNFGTIGFSIYLIFTLMSFHTFRKQCQTTQKQLCIMAVLMLFLMGSAEAAVLVSGTIYYIYMLVILVLSKDYSEERRTFV